jgi:hypothetical protein
MKRLPFAALMLLLLIGSVAAQSTTGRIIGTVADPAGVVPGATIVVTDTKTGRERTVVSSDDGTFTVPQLEFGTYTVRITSTGRKAFLVQDVKIDAGRDYSLNIMLEIGDVNAEVTITAGADLVNASNGELSSTISPKQIQDLPLNGRNPLSLITLQAGTADNSAQGTSINGQRPSAPNITLDGLNIQDNFIRSNASSFTQVPVSTDDVSEITVTTQNASADQGYGAAQIQLVTPRGQSEFHGALYAYNRNSAFAANSFFNNAAKTPRSFRNFNQFGARISGPMPIFNFGEGGPMFLRNKAFFFANYEGLRDIFPVPTNRLVLTDAARQGIFTYNDNSGVRRTVNLFDLFAGNNTGAPTGINPIIASRILANLPRGNSTIVGDQLNTTGYRFVQRETDRSNRFKTRVDVDVNQKNTFNVVYLYNKGENLLADFLDANGFSETPGTAFTNEDQFLVGAYRWTPTARFSNEIRVGGTTSFPQFVRNTGGDRPREFFSLPLINNPEFLGEDQGRNTKTYTFQDTASYTWGNHGLTFGAQYNVFRALRLNSGGTTPTYSLAVNTNTPQITTAMFTNAALFPGGIGNTARTQANQLYALLGGIISSQSQTFNVIDRTSGFVPFTGFRQDYAYENLGFFISDQWRFRPNLTLNLGLRYELWTPLRERNGVISEVAIPEGKTPEQALLDPNGFLQVAGTNFGNGALFRVDKNNFAPNVSVAWSPDFGKSFLSTIFPGGGKTVLRGGFRISYINDEYLKAASGMGDVNAGLRINTSRTNLNERVGSQGSIATPTVEIPMSFARVRQLQANQGQVFAVNGDIQVPQNYEYSVGIQREIGWKTAIEIRYVGAFSHNSTRYSNRNQINIFSNGFYEDFLRAQQNCRLQGAQLNPNAANPLLACTSAGFNPNIPGSQPLTIFSQLSVLSGTPGGVGSASAAANSTILGNIQGGLPGQLAAVYIANNLTNGFPFVANQNILFAGLLDNTGRYDYNGLQVEVRRRFSGGLSFQANYTFQKTLTNFPGTDQRRFEFELDARRPELEYARAQTDVTHVFNFNSIYELPFGRGKRFLSGSSRWLDLLVGGWQLNTIVKVQSGTPFGIFDPRGTLNYTNQSTRNPANSPLSKEEIKKLVGIFKTPDGKIYFINPAVIDPVTGRGANGYGSTPFAGQVFFNVDPGQVGNVERFFLNGPMYFNVDASLFKNIRITETSRLQLRMEAFNALNRTNFGLTAAQQLQNINSANFGRVTAAFGARVVQFAARFEF